MISSETVRVLVGKPLHDVLTITLFVLTIQNKLNQYMKINRCLLFNIY